MNKKGVIIILEAKSFYIPFSEALQKRGTRAEREMEEGGEEKGEWEKKTTKWTSATNISTLKLIWCKTTAVLHCKNLFFKSPCSENLTSEG